jgi:MarR family transcriptional regulator for hemolysin
MWLILLNLKINPQVNQRGLAAAVGVREATLTHHLNAMEKDGLLTRRRDPGNRRIHIIEPSDAGDALFLRLREAAMQFDRRLRHDLTKADVERLASLLARLASNAGGTEDGPLWAGLADARQPAATRSPRSRPARTAADSPPRA